MYLLQVSIRSDAPSNGQINGHFTNPLANNMHIFVNLVYAILAILAILQAYKIYNSWVQGDLDEVIPKVIRWFLGMVLCIFLLFGLERWMATNPVSDSGQKYELHK